MVDGSWSNSEIFGKSELGLGSHRLTCWLGDSLVKLDFEILYSFVLIVLRKLEGIRTFPYTDMD